MNQQNQTVHKRYSELNVAVVFLIISISCFLIHFLFFRYSFPPINADEASFFSPAYNLAKKGVLSSEIHQSFLPGAKTYTYWMPPFYMVFLGTLLKLFGATVLNAKLISSICTCCSALLISFISKDRLTKICSVGLFLICPFIIITSAFIRVEALSILLITASIIAVKFDSNNYKLGILAGLSVMTHPLLLACCVGLALITIRRGLKPFITFSVIALITISPYIFYILKDFEFFKLQMALQFLRKSHAKLTDLKLIYLLQSIPIAIVALFCLYKVKQVKELKLFLLTSIILSLIIILKSNEFNYQVYLVPYVIASIALVIDESRNSLWYRYFLPFGIYSFFLILLVFKYVKYDYLNDRSYQEIVSYLKTNQNWKNKNIYAVGGTDVSNFFITNNQYVERPIPIAISKSKNWFDKYTFVIEVINTKVQDDTTDDSKNKEDKPWLTWKNKSYFTTKDGMYSLHLFSR